MRKYVIINLLMGNNIGGEVVWVKLGENIKVIKCSFNIILLFWGYS